MAAAGTQRAGRSLCGHVDDGWCELYDVGWIERGRKRVRGRGREIENGRHTYAHRYTRAHAHAHMQTHR